MANMRWLSPYSMATFSEYLLNYANCPQLRCPPAVR